MTGFDRPRFAPPSPFLATLRERARGELASLGRGEDGGRRIVCKTAVIAVSLVASYALLVAWASAWWHAMLLGFVLAQSIAMVGFNVMHDAGHGAYSRTGAVNRAMGFGLDLVGGSIRLWRYKHGVLHHSYPNIDGHDDDLDTSGLFRLHPSQSWRPHQRYQALYAVPLYSLLALHWVVGDFIEFFRNRIGRHRLPPPSRRETLAFIAFKLNFVVWMLVVPLWLHPWWIVLLAFVGVMLVVGATIAIVFQLAHVSDLADAPAANEPLDEWAAHQLRTTVDFAPGHPLWSWMLGGLNTQVVHHLLPKTSHVHYGALQPIVARSCHEFGLAYRCFPTMRAAIASHFRRLHALGQKPGLA